VPSTARGGHVFAARAGHERDDTCRGGRHRAGDLNATKALVVAFIVNSGMTHVNAGHLLWVQSVPVTAIPWGRMKTEQHNLVIRSIRKHD
jgi:hypothetical protein